jgi:hypothetical protein
VRTNLITIAANSAIECDCSERSSVSALGNVVVSNGDRGFDIYSLDSGAQVCSAVIPPGTACATAPVLFIHGGFAFVGGCLSGGLRFWDVKSGARIQNMKHGKIIIAFAIARPNEFLRPRTNYPCLCI